jgi:hypothetical protein
MTWRELMARRFDVPYWVLVWSGVWFLLAWAAVALQARVIIPNGHTMAFVEPAMRAEWERVRWAIFLPFGFGGLAFWVGKALDRRKRWLEDADQW